MNDLTHGSLFSGIGGFEEGAMRSGIPTLWSCEINAKKKRNFKITLQKHFDL
jgi:DNA (cytosine-5)-methyltransferase 1